MERLLIAFEPPQEVSEILLELKKEIYDSCGFQHEVHTPPHCTFVVNNFCDIQSIENTLEQITRTTKAMPLTFNGMRTFSAKNAKVLYAHVEKTQELQDLQVAIVTQTQQYLEAPQASNLPPPTLSHEHHTNLKKYNFAFVGNTWIPHCTAAILDTAAYTTIGQKLLQTPISAQCTLSEITLFTKDTEWKPYKHFSLQ